MTAEKNVHIQVPEDKSVAGEETGSINLMQQMAN